MPDPRTELRAAADIRADLVDRNTRMLREVGSNMAPNRLLLDIEPMLNALAAAVARAERAEGAAQRLRDERDSAREWHSAEHHDRRAAEAERDRAVAELAEARNELDTRKQQDLDYWDAVKERNEARADLAEARRTLDKVETLRRDAARRSSDFMRPTISHRELAEALAASRPSPDAATATTERTAAELTTAFRTCHADLVSAAIHGMADRQCDIAAGDSYDPERYREDAEAAVDAVVEWLAWSGLVATPSPDTTEATE